MDTDDLSEEAYKTAIVKSDLFHHDLTLQFGVLASDCKNKTEYLEKSLFVISEFESDIEIAMSDIFYDNIPQRNMFESLLSELKSAIKEVQNIPMEKRT